MQSIPYLIQFICVQFVCDWFKTTSSKIRTMAFRDTEPWLLFVWFISNCPFRIGQEIFRGKFPYCNPKATRRWIRIICYLLEPTILKTRTLVFAFRFVRSESIFETAKKSENAWVGHHRRRFKFQPPFQVLCKTTVRDSCDSWVFGSKTGENPNYGKVKIRTTACKIFKGWKPATHFP